jgi:NitT/TauT family transport system ATP-binding protein
MPVIASQLHMEVDDLFPIAETLQLMRFAEVERGDIRLTDAGEEFAAADVDDRKKLFQRQLPTYVPLAAHIRRVLQERANHTAPPTRFRNELEDHMTTESATRALGAVIAWARFAEAFAYDARSETFSLALLSRLPARLNIIGAWGSRLKLARSEEQRRGHFRGFLS